jgi:FkbM family methyltransferase
MSTELKQRLLLQANQGRDDFRAIKDLQADATYLYGAGFVGRWACKYLKSIGSNIQGFIDSDPARKGTVCMGYPIYGPNDSAIHDAKSIIITSRHAVPAINQRLLSLGKPLISIDAFVVHAEMNNRFEIVEALFEDDPLSQNIFYSVLLSMLQGSTDALAPYASSVPYFERFRFFNTDGEMFFDAGAYVGDSLERFIWSVNGVFKHAYVFEPGIRQFNALKARINRLNSEWALDIGQILAERIALSSAKGEALISKAEKLTQSALHQSSNAQIIDHHLTTVPMVSLDEYLDHKPVTIIKVDVEGSEADFLIGARHTIINHKPKLALSIYHYPTDIFELPIAVHALGPSYSFGLGHHSSKLMETVLYCSNNE